MGISINIVRSWLATLCSADTLRLLKKDESKSQPYLAMHCKKRKENARDLQWRTDLPEQTFPPEVVSHSLTQILDDRFYPGEPLVDNSGTVENLESNSHES